MPCCCNRVFKLCDIVVCDEEDLVLPIPIPADGEYTMVLDFLGDDVRKTASFTEGNNATFDKEGLNERFTYVGHVESATGEVISFTVEGVIYDCFEFNTKRSV